MHNFENETVTELRDILIRNGFSPCDMPGCNCGGWHHRYGLPERWEEVKQAVADAGYPLSNENGHRLIKAVDDLVSERDRLRKLVADAADALDDLSVAVYAPSKSALSVDHAIGHVKQILGEASSK